METFFAHYDSFLRPNFAIPNPKEHQERPLRRSLSFTVISPISKLVTLSDTERSNGHYFALFYQIRYVWGPITSKWLKIDLYSLQRKCSPKNLVLAIYHFWRYSQRLPRMSALLIGTCAIYTVSGKKETKMFSVISLTKLGQL